MVYQVVSSDIQPPLNAICTSYTSFRQFVSSGASYLVAPARSLYLLASITIIMGRGLLIITVTYKSHILVKPLILHMDYIGT